MLETRFLPPVHPTDRAPVLVLLHGRGADPDDLAALRRWLPDSLALVLPRAPFEAAPWGYGAGWAWYRYEGDDRPEEKSFRASQAELDALLEELPSSPGTEPGPVFLGGFSQGGTMSLGRLLRGSEGLAGVLNFSGFVPAHPDVATRQGPAGETPVFWGHGTLDASIPFQMALRGRERLRAAGVPLEARDYAMGHGIIPEEVRDAVEWILGVLETGRSARDAREVRPG